MRRLAIPPEVDVVGSLGCLLPRPHVGSPLFRPQAVRRIGWLPSTETSMRCRARTCEQRSARAAPEGLRLETDAEMRLELLGQPNHGLRLRRSDVPTRPQPVLRLAFKARHPPSSSIWLSRHLNKSSNTAFLSFLLLPGGFPALRSFKAVRRAWERPQASFNFAKPIHPQSCPALTCAEQIPH